MTEEHPLPRELREATAAVKGAPGPQESCPFGDGVVAFNDALLACETCEELFTPQVREGAFRCCCSAALQTTAESCLGATAYAHTSIA